MRIEFLTQEDPIYILPFFDEFFRHYSEAVNVVRISSCKTMGNRSRRQLLTELCWLYGPWGLARLLARVLVARVLGLLRLRRGAKAYFTLAQLCRTFDVEYRSIENPNAPEFLAEVIRRKCDLVVSVACPCILKARLLSVPPMGCINLHHAPLPRYKGMMPTFWQLYHGEQTVGMTIHYMTEDLDGGDILLQEKLAIEDDECLDNLIRRSKRFGAHCLAQVLTIIDENRAVPVIDNDREQGNYFTFPTFAEIREFRRRGLRAL